MLVFLGVSILDKYWAGQGMETFESLALSETSGQGQLDDAAEGVWLTLVMSRSGHTGHTDLHLIFM